MTGQMARAQAMNEMPVREQAAFVAAVNQAAAGNDEVLHRQVRRLAELPHVGQVAALEILAAIGRRPEWSSPA